jgi:glyceraldehyde 3-phosphate dehydrogenase
MRIGINGFGRIGRTLIRILTQRNSDKYEIIAINDLTDTATLAHLLKYDSVHGNFKGEITFDENHLIINGKKIKVSAEKNPVDIPWKNLKVDLVIESTGKFLTSELAQKHIG